MNLDVDSAKNLSSEPQPEPGPPLLPTFALHIPAHLWVIFGLLAILLVFRWPVIIRFSTHYLGGVQGDAGLYSWLMQTVPGDLRSLPWFSTRGFYPYGNSLAWSDNFILPAMIAAPLLAIGISAQAVFNSLIVGAGFLNGYLTFRLFYQLTGEVRNAFSVGAALMTATALTHHLGHPQLQFFFFIPLTLLAVFAFLRDQRFIRALPIGIVLLLCFLTTVYYFVFAALTATLVVGTVLLLRPQEVPFRKLSLLVLGAGLGLLPVVPFVLPYLDAKDAFGARQLYEAYYFGASARSYVSAAPHNLLYGVLAPLSHSEAHLFPGLILLLIPLIAIRRLGDAKSLRIHLRVVAAAFAAVVTVSATTSTATANVFVAILLWTSIVLLFRLIVRMGRMERKLEFRVLTGRDLIAIFTVLALIFFALSFGPLGNPEKHQLALAPFRLAYEAIPGFAAIRASARCGLVALFALCMLYGLALSKLSHRSGMSSAILLPTAFLLIENFHLSIPVEAPRPAPPALSEVGPRTSALDSVIVLPYAGELEESGEVKYWSQFAAHNVTAMRWLLPFGRLTMNGYSGQRTKLMRELPRELRNFPDERSLQALRRVVGLRYIFYDSSSDTGFDAFSFHEKSGALTSELRLVAADDFGGYLFELSGVSKINEELELLAPPWEGNSISLNIRSDAVKDRDRALLEVYMREGFDLGQIATIPFNPDGTWQEIQFSLPSPSDAVRPMQLILSAQSAPHAMIREIKLVNHSMQAEIEKGLP